MSRHHTIGTDGGQVDVEFTPEEEAARDAEEAAWAAGSADREAWDARRAVLDGKLTDGSITHSELVELLQHRES